MSFKEDTGQYDVDVRPLLANERTLLAWIGASPALQVYGIISIAVFLSVAQLTVLR